MAGSGKPDAELARRYRYRRPGKTFLLGGPPPLARLAEPRSPEHAPPERRKTSAAHDFVGPQRTCSRRYE